MWLTWVKILIFLNMLLFENNAIAKRLTVRNGALGRYFEQKILEHCFAAKELKNSAFSLELAIKLFSSNMSNDRYFSV